MRSADSAMSAGSLRRRSCNDCPDAGARCLGLSHFQPMVEGSVWEDTPFFVMKNNTIESKSIVKRVARCPAGYILVRNDSTPRSDTCVACSNNTYSAIEAVYATKTMWNDSQVDARSECIACPSAGAMCNGTDQIIPLAGWWRAEGEVGGLPRPSRLNRRSHEKSHELAPGETRVYRCPPGACADNGTCADPSREGKVCGLCKKGYALSGAGTLMTATAFVYLLKPVLAVLVSKTLVLPGTTCTPCKVLPSEDYQKVAFAILLPFFFAVWYLVSWRQYFVYQSEDDEDYDSDDDSEPVTCFGKCLHQTRIGSWFKMQLIKILDSDLMDYAKIFISFWQVPDMQRATESSNSRVLTVMSCAGGEHIRSQFPNHVAASAYGYVEDRRILPA